MALGGDARPGLRERKKQRTRDLIVASARALFTERGYDATSVTDIADEADIAVSTFFGYFPSKVDVLFAGYDDVVDAYIEAVRGRAEGESALQATVRWHEQRLSRRAALDDGSAEAEELDWQVGELRRILAGDPLLQAIHRERYTRAETFLVTEIARDLGDDPADLRPQLIASLKVSVLTTFLRLASGDERARVDRADASAYVDACLTAAVDAIQAIPVPVAQTAT